MSEQPATPQEPSAQYLAFARTRFDAKIAPQESGCIEWIAGRDRWGYGTMWFNRKHRGAHTMSWFFNHNAFPVKGKILLHSCDNPKCVNVQHLREGTHQDNSNDKVSRGRQAFLKGEKNGQSKLKRYQVDEIRAKINNMDLPITIAALAREYKVGEQTIRDIVQNRTWVV